MKFLFLVIFSAVFSVTSLVAPNAFTQAQQTPQPGDPSVITYNGNSNVSANSVFADSTEEPEAIARNSSDASTDVEQPTPTEVPSTESNPTAIFGDAKVTDNFDRGSSGFGLSAGLNDDDAIRIIALNNRLSLEPKKSNGWLSWRLRPPTVQDGAAEMDFSFTTCARGDRTGILMHATDYTSGHGYYFSLACEGTVMILQDSNILGTADASSIFRNSSGDINTLTAIIRGDTLTASLNGEIILTVQDSTYAEGFSGFFTAPQSQNTLTMEIEEFREFYNEN